MAVALQVFDVGNEALVPEAQLNQYPSTEADITVEVILRPKIDVYPASTTLVKSQVITNAFATLERGRPPPASPASTYGLVAKNAINEQFRKIYE